MLESLKLDPTEDTPLIDFDPTTGVLKISGRALPEDAHEFFKPIESWVKHYMEKPVQQTVVEMRIDYFNSAATRYIFNMLMHLEDLAEKGRDVKVIWFYKQHDDMIEAKGEELESMLELPFEMKII